METSREIDVTNLDAAHRRAFEEVIGTPLQGNERLVIRVTDPELHKPEPAQSLADWTRVLAGLSGEEVDSIDRDLKTRADLGRELP
jgi:hypothetical protein